MKHELKYIDDITKLTNRDFFLKEVSKFFKHNATTIYGVNIIISISGIVQANEQIGYLNVNNFFYKIAEIFNMVTQKNKNTIISRMNGTEFCLFLPECSDKKALYFAKEILCEVEDTILAYNLDISITYISIGLYSYTSHDTINTLLTSSDEALRQAKINKDKIYQKSSYIIHNSIDVATWDTIINRAITNNNFNFISFKAIDTKLKKVIHNRLSITLKDENSVYKYSQFMPIANKLGLSHKIYNNILETIFKSPDNTLQNYICSLRLPYEYLVLDESYLIMEEIFKLYNNTLKFKLIIEVSAKFAFEHPTKLALYKTLLLSNKIGIGLYKFNKAIQNFNFIKTLKPVYIKSDANYLNSLDAAALAKIKLLTKNANIDLIATNVKDIRSLEQLEKKDIYFIQGSVINLL